MRVFLSAQALGLMLTVSPASAAVILAPGVEDRTAAIAASPGKPVESGWSVGQSNAVESESPVTVLGNTLTSYASMLPAPADWMLLLTGFSVIGYAMRSRKRDPISFN